MDEQARLLFQRISDLLEELLEQQKAMSDRMGLIAHYLDPENMEQYAEKAMSYAEHIEGLQRRSLLTDDRLDDVLARLRTVEQRSLLNQDSIRILIAEKEQS